MAHPTDPVAYPILTDRLLLRPFDAVRDVAPMAAYRGREDVLIHTTLPTSTPEEIAERLAGERLTRSRLGAEGDVLSLAVEERSTGRMVGDLVLMWHSEVNQHAELGWTITPEVQGRGYAVEVTRALVDVAFATLGLRRLTAVISEGNAPSLAVARRLGMRQEARRVDAERVKGEWATVTEWALLSSEWTPGG